MATKPTSDPTWATGGSPNIANPSTMQSAGYPDGFPPPAGNHNWQFKTLGEWVDYLRQDTVLMYDDLDVAIAEAADDDTFELRRQLAPPNTGDAFWALSSTVAGDFRKIDVDGYDIAVYRNTGGSPFESIELYDARDVSAGPTFAGALGASSTVNGIKVLGGFIAASFDDQVALIDSGSGSILLQMDLSVAGTVAYDVVLTPLWLYAIAADGNIYALSRTLTGLQDPLASGFATGTGLTSPEHLVAGRGVLWAGGTNGHGYIRLDHLTPFSGTFVVVSASATYDMATNGEFVHVHGATNYFIYEIGGASLISTTALAVASRLGADSKYVYAHNATTPTATALRPDTGDVVASATGLGTLVDMAGAEFGAVVASATALQVRFNTYDSGRWYKPNYVAYHFPQRYKSAYQL